MTEILKEADALLKEIGHTEDTLRGIECLIQTKVDAIRRMYAIQIRVSRDDLAGQIKALQKLMKANKDVIFSETVDRVDLDHGALLIHVTRRVKRVKKMVDKLEAAGLSGAIRTAKTANWDEIEKWDDEQLARVGTERVKKEKFEYELKR